MRCNYKIMIQCIGLKTIKKKKELISLYIVIYKRRHDLKTALLLCDKIE